MTEFKKEIWFPAKSAKCCGWGLPTCWQGWAVIIIFYLLMGSSAFLCLPRYPAIFVLTSVVLVILLIGVCYLKGEKARWRWGKD
jgi:hypothetical protein